MVKYKRGEVSKSVAFGIHEWKRQRQSSHETEIKPNQSESTGEKRKKKKKNNQNQNDEKHSSAIKAAEKSGAETKALFKRTGRILVSCQAHRKPTREGSENQDK